MDKNDCGDLRISGSGSASGGKYNRVRISGSGKITGDIECSDFSISGTVEASGKVSSEKLSINGSCNIIGAVNTGDLKVSGSAQFGSSITGGDFHVSGSALIRGGLNANNVKIDGSIEVADDCNAEQFRSNGIFNIGGLLNADEIDIRLHWHKSTVREIGGSRINVQIAGSGSSKFFKSLLPGHNPALETEVIEGDEIRLENTVAKIVRGNKIIIGKGCNIETVEYKDLYQKDIDSKVLNERKM